MSYLSSFPPENVSPADKEKPAYGVSYAQAMLHAYNFYAANIMSRSRDIEVDLDNLAQGKIDTDSIKKLLGYVTDNASEKTDSISYMDVEVPNILTRLVANAVGKLNKLRYDITLTPIDPTSIDFQKQYEAKVKAYQEMKSFINHIQVPAQELFGDIDFDAIPEEPDDIMIEAQINPKINRAMKAEMTIKMLHAVNDWPQKQNDLGYNLVVHGMGIIHAYLDENLVPRERVINKADFVHSAVSGESFDNLEYAGHLERISPNQFRREASAYLTPEEIDAIIAKFTPSHDTYAMAQYESYDGLGRITVLRYQFLSENQRTYVTKKGKFGNKIFQEKSFDFSPEDIERPKYESGAKRIIRNTYTAKYSGTFVLDTEVVYGHGLDSSSLRNPTRMVNEQLNYLVYAPFMRNGVVISPLEQALEPFRMFVIAWNKAKKIVARGWNGAMEIDFSALESVALGKGGQLWTPRKLMQMFFQEGILIKRKNLNQYGQSQGQSITPTQIGLTLTDYFNTMTSSGQLMKEVLGLNDLSDGSNPPSRTAVGVMAAAQVNSNTNIDYLFKALISIYERTSKSILLLAQKSVKSGNRLAGWIPAMGRLTAKFFEVDSDLALYDFGLVVEQQVSQEMWDRVYGLLDKMVELGEANGGISPDDAFFIFQIDNLKQAMELTMVRRKRRAKEAKRIADEAAQRQIEINTSQAKATTDGQMQVLKETEAKEMRMLAAKKEVEKELIELKGRLAIKGLDITARRRLEGVKNTNTTNMIREEQKKEPKNIV